MFVFADGVEIFLEKQIGLIIQLLDALDVVERVLAKRQMHSVVGLELFVILVFDQVPGDLELPHFQELQNQQLTGL